MLSDTPVDSYAVVASAGDVNPLLEKALKEPGVREVLDVMTACDAATSALSPFASITFSSSYGATDSSLD